MAQIKRSKPTFGEAMAAFAGRPVGTLGHLEALGLGTRMTLLREANAGNLPGVFRVGRKFSVATAPWRERLGIEATPELARFMPNASPEPAESHHEAA